MIHTTKKHIPSTEKIIKHKIASCIKCGGDDIRIEEYEDQFGFISTATCKNKNCKNEQRVNASETHVITQWNKNNHIPTVIKDKKLLIKRTQSEIEKLVRLAKKI
jgi:hypothetical protein